MLENILPEKFYRLLTQKVGLDNIYEIRLRANLPVGIISGGKAYFLTENGLSFNPENALTFSKSALEDIIYKASQFSIYSITEELKAGYIVLDDGVRIGIAGSVVMDAGKVQTITNFSSLNIRIPHIVRGVSAPVFDKLIDNDEIFNTLIISSPGQGKTTFLRDFAFMLSKNNYFFNVLVLDERGEIAGKDNRINLGKFCDVLSFCTKEIGFLQGIRAMNPDIILTDELGAEEDFQAVKFAQSCGVKIVATIHAANLQQLKSKPYFDVIKNVFQRFVFLAPSGRAGQIVGVFDQNFKEVL